MTTELGRETQLVTTQCRCSEYKRSSASHEHTNVFDDFFSTNVSTTIQIELKAVRG